MIIQVNVKDINSVEEQFLAEKLMAYVDLIVDHPNFLLDATVKNMSCRKAIDLKDKDK